MKDELVGRLSLQKFPQMGPTLQEHYNKLHNREILVIELFHANDSDVDINAVPIPLDMGSPS
jgi:hypothetical protein